MTKRFRLQISGTDVVFHLLMFDNKKGLHEYSGRKIGKKAPSDVGAGCCMYNNGSRTIDICLTLEFVSHHIIGHEAFHATLAWARMNKRRYTRSKWLLMLTCDDTGEYVDLREEDLADICGSLISEIWRHFRKSYVQKGEWA